MCIEGISSVLRWRLGRNSHHLPPKDRLGGNRRYSITATKYWDKILRDVILLFRQACPAENFILWITPKAIVTAYKQANNTINENWPTRSPHLNLIAGHAWDTLKRPVNARQPAPNSLTELSLAVQERWNTDQKKLRRLCAAFHLSVALGLQRTVRPPRLSHSSWALDIPNSRFEAIQARGGYTHYQHWILRYRPIQIPVAWKRWWVHLSSILLYFHRDHRHY